MNNSSNAKRIHLIAVCGTGMASLAGLLKEKGFAVTGSDQNVYPPMSDQLAALGVDVMIGFKPENIETARPELVVVGNAISRDNAEVLEVQRRGLPILSMPQAIARFFLEDRFPIVVAGTHGKTTTASLLAWVLQRSGQSPGFFVGGILKNFGRSYQVGTGDAFVLEGDEYDTAFFDKGPKFLHYRPRMLILNAVEFDHADIYKNLDDVMESFAKLVALLRKDGVIFADGDNANVRKLVEKAPCRVVRFGLEAGASISADDVIFGGRTRFRALRDGREFGRFESPLPGRHNLKNLLAVLGVALERGMTIPDIQRALAEFESVKRRQEVLGTFRGVTLIDDFAHHPTAVAETLAALRGRYGKAKLWAVFEPRSNTTRRNIFQKDFARAFDPADEIVFAAPYLAEKIPEGERLHPEEIVADLKALGKKAFFLPSIDEIVALIARESRSGDIVCFMSNGGFGGIYDKTIAALKSSANMPI
ncbi:MAG TPA: UDP-N-acetylmuramate:L-alanyl-gamma-D-glutamyl-meso-diaminopimelate ligase [bacterium]|nr:UDP-N-acetylmuramate:L-alanyl-gamma-D-glutamyl-meso-diaminopimelate ligase [bacterium]